MVIYINKLLHHKDLYIGQVELFLYTLNEQIYMGYVTIYNNSNSISFEIGVKSTISFIIDLIKVFVLVYESIRKVLCILI